MSVPTASHDEPQLLVIAEGERAPWNGILINEAAAARILADSEAAERRCEAKVDHELSVLKAEKDLQIERLVIDLEAQREACEAKTRLRDERITVLEERVIEESDDNTATWVAVSAGTGFAVGVVASVLMATALSSE